MNFVSKVIKLNVRSFKYLVELIYSTEVSLFSNIIPEHSDTFIPFLHEFKFCCTININLVFVFGIINEQPFVLQCLKLGDLLSVALVV